MKVTTARRRLLVSARASSEPQDERQTEVDWGKGATVFDSGHDSHEQSRGFGIIERPADPAVDGTPRWFVCDWDHQRAGARSKPIKQTYLELPLVTRHKRVAPKALQQRVLVILGNSKGKEGKTVQKLRPPAPAPVIMQAALTARSAFVARPAAATRAPRVQQRVYAAQYTAEQLAFLERKRSSGGSVAPAAAPARGRSTSATPGLSAEQQAFLARKAQESRSPAPAAAPARGRSASARPSFRASAPVSNSGVRSAMSSSSSSSPSAYGASSYKFVTADEQAKLSKEQCDFLERKRAESGKRW
ncbi:hypothetical protein ABPG75_009988 [Micractinium tetrahymenae]